jgi:hypothetical protein
MTEPSLSPPQDLPLWRRALPFVVAAALVAWVASRLDFPAFLAAIRSTNYVGFVGFAALFTPALIAADVLATTRVYDKSLGPIRYRDLFVIRAASYLPSILNHHLGQAWLTYFLAKAYRVPVTRVAGTTLVVYATTLGGLFVFLVVGVPLRTGSVPWLVPTTLVVGISAIGYALVLLLRPRWLADRAVLGPIFEMGLRGHVVALLWRLPHVFVQFLGAWLPFAFFSVKIPLLDALAQMPVLMFVVTLPVSPQGLGTRDALSLTMFSRYASGTAAERASAVAAATLSWFVVTTLLQLVLSPLFLRPARKIALQNQVEPA